MLAPHNESLGDLTNIIQSALEARGVLGKIRAELRANVFSAIHEEQHSSLSGTKPPALLHEDGAGQMASQLILELLQHCGLDYSYSVLLPEAGLTEASPDRASLASSLHLDASAGEPLLLQLVRAALTGDPARSNSGSSNQAAPAAAKESGTEGPKPHSINLHPVNDSTRAGGPRAPSSGACLGDLPPLSSRSTMPSLSSGASSPSTAKMPAASLGGDEERRLDALESKLASIAGLPIRPGSVAAAPQPKPLPTRNAPTLPSTVTTSAPAASDNRSSVGAQGGTQEEEEIIEDDIIEESFDEDDDEDAVADLSLSSGDRGPPLVGSTSPAHLSQPPAGRSRLSPLESSVLSVDESVSPGRISSALHGHDWTEPAEKP